MIRPRRVLVVTPDPASRGQLADALQSAGHDAEVVRALAGDLDPDLAVVDVESGGADLWSAAELLSTGRLILLVGDVAAMSRGFALGADDCVMPGAPIAEIVARCEASLRRTSRSDSALAAGRPSIYADRRLWVNFELRQVWAGGRSAHLTTREQRLLSFLIQQPDKTVTHEQILAGVWGRESPKAMPTEVLKQYIWRLRRKVEDDPSRPAIIVTVPGEGYRFVSHRG